MDSSTLSGPSARPSGKQLMVLTAPLWMASSSASSRAIAQATGTSQSFVSRTWQLTDRRPDLGPSSAALAQAPERFLLIGFATSTSGSCMVLEKLQRSTTRPRIGLSVASKRRLRTVLSADLLRADAALDGQAFDSEQFLQAIGTHSTDDVELLFIVSGEIALPCAEELIIRCSNPWQWQRAFHLLQGTTELGMGPALSDLVAQLRAWYRTKREPFYWISPAARPADYALPRASRSSGSFDKLREPSELSNDILMWLRQALIHEEDIDRTDIRVKTIGRKLDVPISAVRIAVKALAEQGFVMIRRDGSVAIRLPSAQDMAEAYLARRALGAIAIRAVVGWSAQERQTLDPVIEELRDSVERGDMERAHFADLEFQLGLFDVSPLERIPSMLKVLTHQAFMHFAVIGGRYAFSPRRILEHNCRIVKAINEADAQTATLAWHSKMDEGLRYMEYQIARVAMHRAATGP